jgi:hypothetical protein
MADIISIDPSGHWKATVRLQADGNFTAITVDDTNGITRGRDLTFPRSRTSAPGPGLHGGRPRLSGQAGAGTATAPRHKWSPGAAGGSAGVGHC